MNIPRPRTGEITALQLAEQAGLTYRMLDHWTSRGYLRPVTVTNPGSGRPRLYPAGEVDVAARMRVLVAAGLLPAAAERAARGEQLAPGVEIVLDEVAAGLDVEAALR